MIISSVIRDSLVVFGMGIIGWLFRVVWSKIHRLEEVCNKIPDCMNCKNIFANKHEIATKQDISDILDAKFMKFELHLINEGRLLPRDEGKVVRGKKTVGI